MNICVNSKQYLPLSPKQILIKISFLNYISLSFTVKTGSCNIERENQLYRLVIGPSTYDWTNHICYWHPILVSISQSEPASTCWAAPVWPLIARFRSQLPMEGTSHLRAETQHSQTKNRWFWQRIEFDGCSKMKWVSNSNSSLGCNQSREGILWKNEIHIIIVF